MWSAEDERAVAEALYQYDHGPFRARAWNSPAEAAAQHAYEAKARAVLGELSQRGWAPAAPTQKRIRA